MEALIFPATTPLQCIAVASPSPVEAAVGVQAALFPPFFCFRQEALDEPAEELSGIHRCCMGLVYITFPSQLGLGDVLGLKCAKLKDSSCHSQKMESSLEMGTDMGEHNGAGGVPGDVFFVSGVK